MGWSGDAWRRLGSFIVGARAERGWSQARLAGAAGISIGTVKRLEAGHERGRMPTGVPHIEKALGWEYGSVRDVLDGGYPTSATSPVKLSASQKRACREFLAWAPMPVDVRTALFVTLEEMP